MADEGMHPRDAQRAVGKTIRAVQVSGWRHELVFTDDTKLQIEPGGLADEETGAENAPQLLFQERLDAD